MSKALPGLHIPSRGCAPATMAVRKELLVDARGEKARVLMRHARCTAYRVVGALVRSGTAGDNQFVFIGKLGRRWLSDGSYSASATASPATPPSTASASFRILP